MDILGTLAYGIYGYLFLLRISSFLYLVFISSLDGGIPYFWMPHVEGTTVHLKGTLPYSFGSRMITMELSHHQIQCQQSTLFVFLCSYKVIRLKRCLRLLNIYWYIIRLCIILDVLYLHICVSVCLMRTVHGCSRSLVFQFSVRTIHGHSCPLVFVSPLRTAHGCSRSLVFQFPIRTVHGRSVPLAFQSTPTPRFRKADHKGEDNVTIH